MLGRRLFRAAREGIRLPLNYHFQTLSRVCGLLVLAAGATAADIPLQEQNGFPGLVVTPFGAPRGTVQTKALGPLLFDQPATATSPARRGFRPFWIETTDPSQGTREILSLYPVFRYVSDADGTRWSLFSLIRHSTPPAQAGAVTTESAEVWPFYLRRHDPARGDDYTAIFPLWGSVTHRFGLDRWDFALFPLFSRSEVSGRKVTQTPWPVFRRIEGAGHRGIELWPLYGERRREGDYARSFLLWPLGYKSVRWTEGGVTEAAGFLPFYARSSSPQSKSETFLWPFFGYTERTAPVAYVQRDYFWPLWVQGRGPARTLNRWAPFYTHSVGPNREKTWMLWPLFRHETVRFADTEETDERLLFVLFRQTTQRRPARPEAGEASRTHVWPFLSAWDNGAGQTQLQVFSPLEPFFPNQEAIRVSYSPLFALYRYQQTAPGATRHSLLWDLFTLTKGPDGAEWHVGPLAGGRTGAAGRISLLGGLLGLKRTDSGWRPFVFKFSRQAIVPTP